MCHPRKGGLDGAAAASTMVVSVLVIQIPPVPPRKDGASSRSARVLLIATGAPVKGSETF